MSKAKRFKTSKELQREKEDHEFAIALSLSLQSEDKKREDQDAALALSLQAQEEEEEKKISRNYLVNTQTKTRDKESSKRNMKLKLQKLPFYINRSVEQFSHVQGPSTVHNHNFISIGDILKDAFQEVFQFNYMIDLEFLSAVWPKVRQTPCTIVHGHKTNDDLKRDAVLQNITKMSFVNPKVEMYGTHHSKFMVLFRTNNTVQIVIHTANLVESDWKYKTQGVWMSPHFSKKTGRPKQCECDFENDFLNYLQAYNDKSINDLIKKLKQFDFSTARVHIVGSVPGYFRGRDINKWGHMKMKSLLQKLNVKQKTQDLSVILQFSSIGSFTEQWLTSELKKSFETPSQNCKMNLIFPTVENVRTSILGYNSGNSLPFSSKNAAKQCQFMKKYFCSWKASVTDRSTTMPHIKTYMQSNKDGSYIPWFLLASHNLSKAAWGTLQKNETQLFIRSYELGVLLHESTYSEAKTPFCQRNLNKDDCDNGIAIPVPFDLPLTPYKNGQTGNDEPWVWDKSYTKPDVHNNIKV